MNKSVSKPDNEMPVRNFIENIWTIVPQSSACLSDDLEFSLNSRLAFRIRAVFWKIKSVCKLLDIRKRSLNIKKELSCFWRHIMEYLFLQQFGEIPDF